MRFPSVLLLRPIMVAALVISLLAFGGLQRVQAQGPGTVDPVFGGSSLGLSGNVNVVALQPDGRVLVAGYFGNGLVRLNADGSTDPTFNAAPEFGLAPSFALDALVLQPDGKIVVGGISLVFGETQAGLARFNTDGSLDTGFNAETAGTHPQVSALALQPDGRIVVGGFFSQVNGVASNNLVSSYPV